MMLWLKKDAAIYILPFATQILPKEKKATWWQHDIFWGSKETGRRVPVLIQGDARRHFTHWGAGIRNESKSKTRPLGKIRGGP